MWTAVQGCPLLWCISLSQSVAEALVRFLCERNRWRPAKSFEENVRKLRGRGFISAELVIKLLEIWSKRDDYHHLNPAIEADRNEVEVLARAKVQLLTEVEKDIFDFGIKDGAIVPKNPKYWNPTDNYSEVFLRVSR